MFNYDVKFFTCDDTTIVRDTDLKSFKYESKRKKEETTDLFNTSKRNYCEHRGGFYRPNKLNHIRQLEQKLRDREIIACEWLSDNLVTLVFSSGVIAHLTLKPSTLDVTQILFDRYCLGKLFAHTVTNVVLTPSHILFIHPERVASLLVFGKKNDGNVPSRMSERDPYLQSIELGGTTRKTDRQVSWCPCGTGIRVLVWSNNVADPAPWTPSLEDHANFHLYLIEGPKVSLIAFHQVENDVLLAEISKKHHNLVHIIEQVSGQKSGVNLLWLKYDVPKSERVSLFSQHENSTQVALASPVRVAKLSPCELRLLVASIDGSLHIVHHISGLTHSVKGGFISTDVHWAGDLVIANDENGRLQCFDHALSALYHHSKRLDLTTYFRDSKRIQILSTRKFKGGPMLLASFSGGPLTLLRINHPRLLTAWLRMEKPSNAIELLRTLDWENEGDECLHGISEVVVNSLRKSFDMNVENAIQGALGVYLAPLAPLPASASKYAPPIHDLARKFFHHLLRRGRIEKAMSLGVELEAWDLFCDARWAAARRRHHELASEAAACAAHYAPRSQLSDSECSDSCSQCSSHTSSDSEDIRPEVRKHPPPLPRVSLPTILPVPVTRDPPTTHSIRPNLHQYLERDNTIWTKNINDPQQSMQVIRKRNSIDTLKDTRSEGIIKPTEVQTHEDRSAFNHLFQDIPSYRYSINVPNTNFNERYRQDKTVWPGRTERNKVKFSDTVTIAVVPEQESQVSRELADSLPLCAPDKYLAAFDPGTDYVHV